VNRDQGVQLLHHLVALALVVNAHHLYGQHATAKETR
jgi:hypothetical protein